MSNKINGRTPEDIAKALRLCKHPTVFCGECPYKGRVLCQDKLREDALERIKQLEKQLRERNALLAVLGVSVPERDAGIKDTKGEQRLWRN